MTLEAIDREAERLLAALRPVDGAALIGGAAVRQVCALAHQPPLRREVGDIDFVIPAGTQDQVGELLAGLGYGEDRETNRIQGDRRLIFYGLEDGLKIDCFVGQFSMCHTVPVTAARSGVADVTSLLLTKLQVVELTDKDMSDLLALFGDHELGDGEEEIDAARIAEQTRTDWGLCTTVSDGLERVAAAAPGAPRGEETARRAEALRGAIEAAEKSRRWKLRERVGRRKRWYELPEEIVEN